VLKLAGIIFTLFYLTGVYFPYALPAWLLTLVPISQWIAFTFFALLLARGARRTSNPFLYFTRLLMAALATEVLEYVAALRYGIYFGGRNALFTYAAALALIAGISMALGCYRDLVARAIPAGGQLDRKILFGMPVNPGHYRMAPATGIILGLGSAGLAVFVSLYFNFTQGLYGLLLILLIFMALGDESNSPASFLSSSVYGGGRELIRTFLYAAALTAAGLVLTLLIKPLRAALPLTSSAVVGAILLAASLPDRPRPSYWASRLLYAVLPAANALFLLLRAFLISP